MALTSFAPFTPTGVSPIEPLDPTQLSGVESFQPFTPDEPEPEKFPLGKFLGSLVSAIPKMPDEWVELNRVADQEPAFAGLPDYWKTEHKMLEAEGDTRLAPYARFHEQLEESISGERRGYSHPGEEWRTGRAPIELYREAAELAAARDQHPPDSPEHYEAFKQLQIKQAELEFAEQEAKGRYDERVKAGMSEGEYYNAVRAKHSKVENLPPVVRQIVRGAITADLKLADLISAGVAKVAPDLQAETDRVRDNLEGHQQIGEASREEMGGVMGAIDQAAESVIEFATVNVASGGGGIFPYLFSTATRDGYLEAKEMGFEGSDALKIGGARGLVETAITYATGKALGGGMENPAVQGWLGNLIKSRTGGLSRPIATLISAAGQSGAEATEEVMVEMGHQIIDATVGIDRGGSPVERLKKPALLGALGGGLGYSAYSVVERLGKTAQEIYGKAEEIGKLPPDAQAGFVDGLGYQGEVPPTTRKGFLEATGIAGMAAKYREGFAKAVEEQQKLAPPVEQPPVVEESDSPLTFQTELGSQYTFSGGSTVRNKAARDLPGHEGDSGQKEPSAITYFTNESPSGASAAGLNNLPPQGARTLVTKTDDGREFAQLLIWNTKENKWGKTGDPVEVFRTPQVGMYPLELWSETDTNGFQSFKKAHAGNKIVSMGEPPAAPDPTAAIEQYNSLPFATEGHRAYQPLEVQRLDQIALEDPAVIPEILSYAEALEAEAIQQRQEKFDFMLSRLKIDETELKKLRRQARAIERKGGDPAGMKGFDELLSRYNLATGVESEGRDTSGPELEAELWDLLLEDPEKRVARWEFLGQAIDDYTEAKNYDPATAGAAVNDPGYYDQADEGEAAPKLPNIFLKVGGVNIIQNPTVSDVRKMAAEARREWSSESPVRMGEKDSPVRMTEDGQGNVWIWPAHLAIHEQIEPKLSKQVGRPVDLKDEFEPSEAEVMRRVSGRDQGLNEDAIDKTGQKPRPKPVPGPSAETGEFLQTPATDVDVPGFPLRTLVGLPAIEAVEMARSLGAIVDARVLPPGRRGRGGLNTRTGELVVQISRELGKNHPQFHKTLMHEIGHVLDRLSDLKNRGNLLGRLASLNDYKAAVLVAPPGSKQMIFRNKEIRNELKALSYWWRPIDPATADPKHMQYRNSGQELYADAISVFLNAPGELRARAPKFFDGLLTFFANKPDVAEAYVEYQKILQGSEGDLAKRHAEMMRQNFKDGDAMWRAQLQADLKASRSIWETLVQDGAWNAIDEFRNKWFPRAHALLINQYSPAIDAQKKAGRTDPLDEQANMMLVGHDLPRLNAKGAGLADRLRHEVHQPMLDAGLSADDIGLVLFWKRVVDGRGEVLNPNGYLPPAAAKDLQFHLESLGDQKAAVLEQAEAKFREEFLAVIEDAVDAGLFSRKVFEEKVLPNVDNYAHFLVLHHLDSEISWAMKEVQGTLAPTANPYRAMIIKATVTARAAALNRAKGEIVEHLKRDLPKEIRAIADGDTSAEQPGYKRFRVLEDGKPFTYEVPIFYAQMVSPSFNDIARTLGVKFMRSVYGIFHPLLVKYSFSFAAGNPSRDFERTYRDFGSFIDGERKRQIQQLMASGKTRQEAVREAMPRVTFGEILKTFIANMAASDRRAMGGYDEKINQLISAGALDEPYTSRQRFDRRGMFDDANTIALIDEEANASPGKIARIQQQSAELLDKHLPESLMKWLRSTGRYAYRLSPPYLIDLQETAMKLAGWDMAKRRGYSDRQTAFLMATTTGSPDTKYKGIAADYENGLMMYTTVRLAAWRSQILAAKSSPGGFAFRTAAVTVIPKLVIGVGVVALAKSGVFGHSLAYMLSLLAEDEEDRQTVIPLKVVEDSDGQQKLLYIGIPHDQGVAFWNTILRRTYDWAIENEEFGTTDTMRDLSAEAFGTWSPPVEIAGRLLEYGTSEEPPVDSFYGRPIMTEAQFSENRMAAPKFLVWANGKFGVGGDVIETVTGRIAGRPLQANPDTEFEAAIRNIPYLSRLLKVSRRGLDEEQWNQAAERDATSDYATNSIEIASRETYQLAKQYGRLIRRHKDDRTPEDWAFIERHKYWYNSIYQEARGKIKAEIEVGHRDVADAMAKDLGELTGLFQIIWAAQDAGDEARVEAIIEQIRTQRAAGN